MDLRNTEYRVIGRWPTRIERANGRSLDAERGLLLAPSCRKHDESSYDRVVLRARSCPPGPRRRAPSCSCIDPGGWPMRKIRVGMQRVSAWRNSTFGSERWPFHAPPAVVVQRFLESNPEFEVDSEGFVSSAEDLDYNVELGDAERAIVETIRSTPTGILDRQAIRDRCSRRGVNQHTLGVLALSFVG